MPKTSMPVLRTRTNHASVAKCRGVCFSRNVKSECAPSRRGVVGQCVRVPPVLELPLYTSPTSNANARGALGAFIARLSFLVLDSQ